MEIKYLIELVRSNSNLVKQKEEELIRLESLCGVSGISYEEKVSTSHNANGKEQCYLNYIEAKQELEEFKKSTVNNRIIISKLVYNLPTKLMRNIMYDYCLCDISINKIANKYHYTRQNIYILFNKSVDIMQDEYNKHLTQFDNIS